MLTLSFVFSITRTRSQVTLLPGIAVVGVAAVVIHALAAHVTLKAYAAARRDEMCGIDDAYQLHTPIAQVGGVNGDGSSSGSVSAPLLDRIN